VGSKIQVILTLLSQKNQEISLHTHFISPSLIIIEASILHSTIQLLVKSIFQLFNFNHSGRLVEASITFGKLALSKPIFTFDCVR